MFTLSCGLGLVVFAYYMGVEQCDPLRTGAIENVNTVSTMAQSEWSARVRASPFFPPLPPYPSSLLLSSNPFALLSFPPSSCHPLPSIPFFSFSSLLPSLPLFLSFLQSMLPSLPLSLPCSFRPSLSPLLLSPPSLFPFLPLSFLPSLFPSFPPSFLPSLPLSFLPSLPAPFLILFFIEYLILVIIFTLNSGKC